MALYQRQISSRIYVRVAYASIRPRKLPDLAIAALLPQFEPMDPYRRDVEVKGLRRPVRDFVHTREDLLRKLAWNLDRCVAEVLSRNVEGDYVAFALVNYASAAVALQRRVRADYLKMLRKNTPGVYPPYIHLSGEGGATTREQIYNRVAFQAALADLAELTGRGFVREKRWQDGAIGINLEATAEYQEVMEIVSADAELEETLVNELMPEGKLWWMPIFERVTSEVREWRGVSALRTNLKDWEQLVFDLTPFLD